MNTLIVPGAFTRASSFDRLAAKLGAGVVELPLRSRRLPQLDRGGLSAADQALDQAIDRARAADPGSPLVLVGHSMGGLLALRASTRHALDGLVLLMPAPPNGLAADVARMLVRDPRSALTIAALGVTTFPVRAGWLRSVPRGLYAADTSPEVVAAAARHRADESLLVLLQLVLGSRRAVEPTGIPTLVVGGLDDGLVPAPTVRRLTARLKADYQEHPVAHNFSEDPAGVVVDDSVCRWLASRSLAVAGPRAET